MSNRPASTSARPDEGLDEFVRRVIANAGPPTPDAAATLRRLLPPVRPERAHTERTERTDRAA